MRERPLYVFGEDSVEADAGGQEFLRANEQAWQRAVSEKRLRERDIERHLVQSVKALGGEVRKVQWVGRRGAPDRLVMRPLIGYDKPAMCWLTDWKGGVYVELKAPGVKPETYQLREHERMRAMGQRVVVIDSIEGVEELLS